MVKNGNTILLIKVSYGQMQKMDETALDALSRGVRAVVILDGRMPNATLLELFTEHGAGSIIRSTAPRVKPTHEE